ncbi:predicted protein [Uncinocarpus reesii 1704]|uniref:Putative gamma-glutamylcyclotransferase n=1 Tax=Uncinocarpus reesii (strain UAMH 1704) TaxID=336963 RepID=C4JQY8_UNCRE|nr:uncharacterized protein UREG_03470 [Uncinocarpus reesii 1704]EEP78624.1 predicted protein [Uncinocarpus reesii 1704]
MENSTQIQKDTQRGPERQTAPSSAKFPALLFVYGSLMDTDVIQAVLRIPKPPPLRSAVLSDYKMKMWRIYPTLIPHEGTQVTGKVFMVDDIDQFQRLQKYETRAYSWTECEVELEDGTVARDCRVFIWAGDPDSADLRDGSFDLEVYQKEYKPALFGRV